MLPTLMLACATQALQIQPPTALERCYEGQRIVLRAALELPGELLDRRLLQLYQQPLDVPLELSVPWWNGTDLLEPREELPVSAADSARLVFGGAVREFSRSERPDAFGAPLVEVALERAFVARRAGELTLAASRVRGAYATQFGDDLVLGATALDREEFTLASEARVLRILPLPEAGRPAGFRGAIGDLRVQLELGAPEVAVGAELALRLVVEGEGNHGEFDVADPLLPAGAHVRARSAAHEPGRSRFEFAVVSERAGELELAPLEFAYFDPRVAEYRIARASALRARVVAHATAAPPTPVSSPAPGAGFSARSTLLKACAIGGAALGILAAVWVLALRRRVE
ncbi:MAG: hypothetical protein EPO68_04820 [Planctomycetota bacterium]|nr:MAG: hypothetical protein EPO68_04820 [Planctomycetota bacterium]